MHQEWSSAYFMDVFFVIPLPTTHQFIIQSPTEQQWWNPNTSTPPQSIVLWLQTTLDFLLPYMVPQRGSLKEDSFGMSLRRRRSKERRSFFRKAKELFFFAHPPSLLVWHGGRKSTNFSCEDTKSCNVIWSLKLLDGIYALEAAVGVEVQITKVDSPERQNKYKHFVQSPWKQSYSNGIFALFFTNVQHKKGLSSLQR